MLIALRTRSTPVEASAWTDGSDFANLTAASVTAASRAPGCMGAAGPAEGATRRGAPERAYANPRKRTSGCNSMPYASYTFDLAMLMSSNTS